jgi:hypothetical protein
VKLPANVAAGDVLVVVAGITTKKTDAPFTLHIGAPDPGMGSSSGDGGDGGASSSGAPTSTTSSSGGCAIVRAARGRDGEGTGRDERASLSIVLGLAVTSFLFTRRARRRRQ